MNDSLPAPPRWKDRSDQSDVAERAAGHAFRCASAVPPRPAPPLSRVAARIRGSRPPRRLAWVLAATAFVLGLATAASAAHFNLLPAWLLNIVKPKTAAPAREGARPPRAKAMSPSSPTRAVPPSPPAPSAAPPAPEPAVAVPAAAGITAPIPALAPPSERRASSSPRKVALVERDQAQPSPPRPGAVPPAYTPQVASTTPRAVAPPPPPEVMPSPWQAATVEPARSPAIPPSVAPIAPLPAPAITSPAPAPAGATPAPAPPQHRQGVGKYLAETIHLLRKERAPASALRLLDSHKAELAQAGFGHEALILRVEALLALGRRAEVLHLLDGASLTDVAASRALLVTRGEVRAAANRCAEGIGDFELVLARSRQVDRQALVGRALCRKKLGDLAGARADIQRLREEFPNERLPEGLEK